MKLLHALIAKTIQVWMAILFSKTFFAGSIKRKFWTIWFVSVVLGVYLTGVFPVSEYLEFYILILILMACAIGCLPILIKDFDIEKIEGIDMPADDENKDFSYEKHKNKHWWSFFYWTGWACLLLFIPSFCMAFFIDFGDWLAQRCVGGFSFLVIFVVVRDAIRRKKNFEERHKDK